MAGSRISEDLTITGDLNCKGPVEVWGKVEGDIVAERLSVMGGGRVEGGVQAAELLVHGEFRGSASCSNVEICSGAVVHSTITAKTLACEAGATICGKLEVAGDKQASATPAPARPSITAEVA